MCGVCSWAVRPTVNALAWATRALIARTVLSRPRGRATAALDAPPGVRFPWGRPRPRQRGLDAPQALPDHGPRAASGRTRRPLGRFLERRRSQNERVS